MHNNIKKVKTDAIPLVDELIYYLKILCLESVSKNEEEALKYETLETIKESDLYINCIENRENLYMFRYSEKDLRNTSLPEYLIYKCLNDYSLIPTNIRKELISKKKKEIIENYVEKNNYYRMLNGQPNIEDKEYIYIDESTLPNELKGLIDCTKPIHTLSENECDVLYSFNIIDNLIIEHPKAKYLKYLGSKKISIYQARTAARFVLLRMEPNVPSEITTRFKFVYERNRIYALKVVYNEAFKIGSDYYDNFIQIFIMLNTMIDILAEMPDFIIKRDLFDIQMIRLFFEYHGIDFFPEIPMKYQRAMLRNINRLLKYKSTTKNIIDICALFGFDNVEVFKFYILKDRKVDKFGDYEFYYKDIKDKNGNVYTIPDDDKNFDLRFLKVPIDKNPDDYLHDRTRYTDYDEIVLGDDYWNGEISHEVIKHEIIQREFNYLETKYLSIDTIYSLTEMSFQLIYFNNMIFDDVVVENLLTMNIPPINSIAKFRFTDVMCYLYALMYVYNGVEDDLMDTPTKIMMIKGFNFDSDMNALASYIHSKGFTMEDLGIPEFKTSKDNILTYKQLMNIFTNNKNVYDHVVKQMLNADNKKMYDIYKTIYDSLMINNFSMDFFKMSNGEVAKTYTEFLKDRNLLLYYSLLEIKNIDSDDVKKERINNLIDDIIYIIETKLDSEEFKFLFANLPSISAEAIRMYIYNVVNFFKSYKLDIYNINTVYKFDDRLENKIIIIDGILFIYNYYKQEVIESLSKAKITSKLDKKEYLDIIDTMHKEITYWLELFETEDIKIFDKLNDLYINTLKIDCDGVHDNPDYIISKIKKYSLMHILDNHNRKSILEKKDDSNILEEFDIIITYWMDLFLNNESNINDLLSYLNINLSNKDKLIIDEYAQYISSTNISNKINLFEKMYIYEI